MGYSKSVYDRAQRILDQRRLDAKRDSQMRTEAFLSAHPRAMEIENELTHTFTAIARAMMAGEKEKILSIKEKNLSLQAELRGIYAAAGVTPEELKPRYTCMKCHDRGNVDGVECSCRRELLKQIACDDLNRRSPLSLSDFDSFELHYYPEQFRRKMSNIYNFCKGYAQNFSECSDGILMTGGTGLGKTHLALAIANEVTKKGMGVVYISAPEMVSALEEYQFGREGVRRDITPSLLTECDLLIIDDLGTEFATNFSRSSVYSVFNSRISRGKPTIISTNLSLKELEQAYSDRFVSRVTGYCRRLHFEGNDIRIQKKLERIK